MLEMKKQVAWEMQILRNGKNLHFCFRRAQVVGKGH